jgi:hypothetical protein
MAFTMARSPAAIVNVSSPRLVKRSVRISRTPLSCVLHSKGYETYPAGETFGVALRTR